MDLRPILGRSEYVRTLRTSCIFTAKKRVFALAEVVLQINEARRSRVDNEEKSYQDLMKTIFQRLEDLGALRPSSVEELNSVRKTHQLLKVVLDEGALTIDGSHSLGSRTTFEIMEDELVAGFGAKESGFLEQLKGSPDDYNRFMNDFIAIYRVRLNKRLVELEAGGMDPELPAFLTQKAESSHKEERISTAPLFSEVYARFLEHKITKGLSTKLQTAYRRFYSDWFELMPDKSVDLYTRKEIRDFLLKLLSLPTRNLKAYKNKPIIDLLEMEIPIEKMVSDKTVIEVKKWIQGVYSFCVSEEVVESSPANDLKLNLSQSTSYAAYSDADVQRMLDEVGASRVEWQKWVIYLAAFTGMRRAEIVQLRKEDIKVDQDSGRDYILVTDAAEGQQLKSQAAKRRVPLHKKLIDIGFLNFVSKTKGELFPDVKPQRVTAWFSEEFRPLCGIAGINDLGERQVFHSFRHSVITKALAVETETNVQQVVGHEKQKMGVTSKYLHSQPLKVVLRVIDCIDYEGE